VAQLAFELATTFSWLLEEGSPRLPMYFFYVFIKN